MRQSRAKVSAPTRGWWWWIPFSLSPTVKCRWHFIGTGHRYQASISHPTHFKALRANPDPHLLADQVGGSCPVCHEKVLIVPVDVDSIWKDIVSFVRTSQPARCREATGHQTAATRRCDGRSSRTRRRRRPPRMWWKRRKFSHAAVVHHRRVLERI